MLDTTQDENAIAEVANQPSSLFSARSTCARCGQPFDKRQGGKPQRFCSPECRLAFHSEGGAEQHKQRATLLPSIQDRADLESPKAAVAPSDEGEEFRWGSDSTVLPEQQATAVYFNPNDDLVIRQERSWDRDEDAIIIIDKGNIAAFIDKLTDACGIPSVGKR